MHRTVSRSRLLTGVVVMLIATALLLPGQAAQATFPKNCAAGGVKVTRTGTATVPDTSTGTGLQVRVTITGTSFTIAPTDTAVTLDTASWCLKARNASRVETGTGTSGTATITNKNGVVKPIAHVVVYTVTSGVTDPVGACFDDTIDEDPPVGLWDIKYNGPTNTRGNAALMFFSSAGTCTVGSGVVETIVRAPDGAGANALCQALTGDPNLRFHLQTAGYATAPADFWMCLVGR
jgi:hypothetical protein